MVHKLSAEFTGKDSDRNEEVFSIIWDIAAAKIQTGPCNDGVNMRMVIQFLPPGVKNLNDPGNSTEEFPVSCQLEDSFSGAFMDVVVEQGLICKKQRIQFCRNRKDEMVIGAINDFRCTFIYPFLFWYCLAIGTVPVSAGIEVRDSITTVRTGF